MFHIPHFITEYKHTPDLFFAKTRWKLKYEPWSKNRSMLLAAELEVTYHSSLDQWRSEIRSAHHLGISFCYEWQWFYSARSKGYFMKLYAFNTTGSPLPYQVTVSAVKYWMFIILSFVKLDVYCTMSCQTSLPRGLLKYNYTEHTLQPPSTFSSCCWCTSGCFYTSLLVSDIWELHEATIRLVPRLSATVHLCIESSLVRRIIPLCLHG